jgi:hypothetical protein
MEENESPITLHFVRNDGRRERTRLTHHTLAQARKVAEQVLRIGAGLYNEVDICTVDGHIETIQNSALLVASETR